AARFGKDGTFQGEGEEIFLISFAVKDIPGRSDHLAVAGMRHAVAVLASPIDRGDIIEILHGARPARRSPMSYPLFRPVCHITIQIAMLHAPSPGWKTHRVTD